MFDAKECGQTEIDFMNEVVYIHDGSEFYKKTGLVFRENDSSWCLTLNEISDQLKPAGLLYVIVEGGLSGVIYEYGNYTDIKWVVHGKTKGYA